MSYSLNPSAQFKHLNKAYIVKATDEELEKLNWQSNFTARFVYGTVSHTGGKWCNGIQVESQAYNSNLECVVQQVDETIPGPNAASKSFHEKFKYVLFGRENKTPVPKAWRKNKPYYAHTVIPTDRFELISAAIYFKDRLPKSFYEDFAYMLVKS